MNKQVSGFDDPTDIISQNPNVKKKKSKKKEEESKEMAVPERNHPLSSYSEEVDVDKLEKYEISFLLMVPSGLHTVKIDALLNVYMVKACRESILMAEESLKEGKETTNVQITYISGKETKERGYPVETTVTFSQVVGIQHTLPRIVSISEKL